MKNKKINLKKLPENSRAMSQFVTGLLFFAVGEAERCVTLHMNLHSEENEVSSPASEEKFGFERISPGLARLATCGERVKFGHNCSSVVTQGVTKRTERGKAGNSRVRVRFSASKAA